MTKQASGNFYPLSNPLLSERHDAVWLLLLPRKKNSERRRPRNTLATSVVQIRCSCAKKKIPTYPCKSWALGDNFLYEPRSGQEAQSGLAVAGFFAQFSLSWARRTVNAHVPLSLRAHGNSCCLARFALLLGNHRAAVDIVSGISLRLSLNTFCLFKCTQLSNTNVNSH